MEKKYYTCSEKSSNKYWFYEFRNGLSVFCEWGRIGAPPQGDVTKSFSSQGELNKWLNSKIKEKEKKGYKEVTENNLEKQHSIASKLGFRNKISKMEWVKMRGRKLIRINDYDPDEHIYVEVLDSYSSNTNKKVTRLLLSKDGSWEITSSIVEMDNEINFFDELQTLSNANKFVVVVREMLKEMSITVANIIKTVEFGVLGVRNIFGSGPQQVVPRQNALKSINTTGFSDSVIQKFAVLGIRKLSL